jgi:radical SAM protein with 4Fe4S-binding SPASM domain
MNKRLDLKVGFTCNNNCIFCAQAHKRYLGDQTTESLKEQLMVAKNDGCDEVVFTGGEPTIREDIVQLIIFAHEIGYKLIQIQSNGRMFSYKDFVKRLVDAGADEFSPAIHGHIPEIHDAQTRVNGSFTQTYNGIKNLKDADQHIITNTVITKFNYRFLPEIAEMLIKLNVNQFQLAFVHPIGNSWKFFDVVVPRKSDVVSYVHRALDLAIETGYKPGEVMVEAFPFCFLQGYEAFCSELYIPPAEVKDATMTIKNFEDWRKVECKKKFKQCRDCKYRVVCEGPWKEYSEKFGSEEFKPVVGKEITPSQISKIEEVLSIKLV